MEVCYMPPGAECCSPFYPAWLNLLSSGWMPRLAKPGMAHPGRDLHPPFLQREVEDREEVDW